MFERLSLYLDSLLFGVPPHRVITAAVLEGLAVLGYLEVTKEGIDITTIPNYTLILYAIAVLAAAFSYVIVRRAARASFSPVLHTRFVPGVVTVFYLLLGGLVVSLGFTAHALIFQQPLTVTSSETITAIPLSIIMGASIVFYFDRYEIESPSTTPQLHSASEMLFEKYEVLRNTDQPAINHTQLFEEFEELLEECSNLLEEAQTKDGIRLADDTRSSLESLQNRQSAALKGRVLSRRQLPKQQELKEQSREISSVLNRVDKITDHE